MTVITALLLRLLKIYSLLAYCFARGHCRFYPSCSAYTYESLQRHGALRGSYYSIRRLLRCHPYHVGGIDHVP